MRRRKISPNFLARSVKLRWLRSSPTWSQLPKIGTGRGPGGSLKRLPRNLDMTMAPIMAAKSAKRVFSIRRRSMVVGWWCRNELNDVLVRRREVLYRW
ncbi:hypothetical protein HanRHA438_Chr06g0275031 [Helianthus annuus]|nr:hypothetical protein HanIR_Chr06g0286101 [Helianthus annuus]KAJ0912497.1 hypothetical protein HanRHA438_Chr06g0275031 [Helianthus annuus]